MTVAITGASGHIGANLVRALLADGRKVRAVVYEDDIFGIEGLDVECVSGDVRDEGSLQRAFTGAEVVYHLAAEVSLENDRKGTLRSVNAEGTHNVVEACLAMRVSRLVHFSSVHALRQEPQDEPFDETRPMLGPREGIAYDRTKAEAEREVYRGIERGLDAVVLNPSGVLGPNDFRGSPMGEVFTRLATRKLPALVPGGFHWVDARDVCDAARAAEKKGRTGERYILCGQWASIRELALLAQDTTGVPPPRLSVPMWVARVSAPVATWYSSLRGKRPVYTSDALDVVRSANRQMRHDKARRELDFDPRPLQETVADTCGWLKEAGRI